MIIIPLLIAFLACGVVYTQAHTAEHEYIVVPATEDPSYIPGAYNSDADSTITFWDLPLRLKMIHVFSLFLAAIGLAKLSP